MLDGHLEVFHAARLLDNLGARLGSLGREFTSPRFTDRHGDGPVCLDYEKQAYAMADRLRASINEAGPKEADR